MKKKDQVLKIAKEQGFIKANDLEQKGISRNYLYVLHKEERLTKLDNGLYVLSNYPYTEHSEIAGICKRYPSAVICLISSLDYYNLTTQIPHKIWIALPRGTWHPKLKFPPLNVRSLSGETYSFGITEIKMQGVNIKVYSAAKTIADCFRFRNKIGLDVAIEALKDAWRSQIASVDELMLAARVCKVDRIMQPYLEAIVHR